jgi:phenylpropionate dioxygenase-like ring-hydroxylating dioxygenase large terminal subunit
MPAPGPDVIAAAREVIADCGRCADPIASAQVLPAQAYVSETFWRFERWAIFARQWLFVGHVNQVPNPRDYLPRTILGEPILITRDNAGKVRVLSAICQHRGHPILGGLKAPPAGAACLNSRSLVCPYHGWTYNMDGTLLWAPEMEQTTPLDELRKETRLPEIRCEIFHGLIFINFDPAALPLAPALAKMDRAIAGFGLGEMIPMPVRLDADLRCNWKAHHENALEPYHTDYVHKSSHASAPANLSKFMEFSPGDGQVMTTTDFTSADADLFSKGDQTALPVIAGLGADERRRLLFISVLPTFFAVFQPSAVMATLILPRGPSLMDTFRFALYPKTTVEMPGFEELYRRRIAAQGAVIQEDIVTQNAVQEGRHSHFAPRGRLSWLETTIPQMNQWLLERYRGALETLPTT